MRVLSVDIGVHNTALYLEEYNEKDIENVINKYKITKTEKRYDSNGLTIGNYKNIVEEICKIGDCIYVDKYNLSEKKGALFDVQTFINFTYYLDKHRNIMDTVDTIVIEQQLKTNPMAQRVEQHCISWFTFNYLDSKEIIVFPSRNKYLMLGLPKNVFDEKKKIVRKITKNERKKWACDYTLSILTNKKINEQENIINSNKLIEYIFKKNSDKKDDISDTICQLNAYKIKKYLDKKNK
jgi:hypothetical protein